MRPTTSAGFAASFGLALLFGSTADVHAQSGDSASSAPAGFPSDMLYVEGGRLTLGSTHKDLLDITKSFYPNSPRPRMKLLRNLMSELGERDVEVEGFFLHRYLVTNEQYFEYVEANKGKVRFPFHWWKFGKQEDWKKKQPEYRAAYKGQRNADLLYWEANWEKLPYAIPEGEEKLPVVFVSWNDAQGFAGWAGMRLPTEAEWTWAASGGEKKQYLWGDTWEDSRLKDLHLEQSRDKTLKPVGALGAFARGKFGHDDMVGNVWEWTSDIGYFPLADEKSYEKELKKLRKNKATADIKEPDWSGAKRIMKGASYFSYQDPAQFRIATRAPLSRTQTIEGAGFRLAKSSVPGRDMCRSRISVEYDGSFFGGDREPDIENQAGVERYELSSDGHLIRNYHSVSLIPVNYMSDDKKYNIRKLTAGSQEKPVIVGTLVSTEPLSEPELPAGMYTVYYRESGMPKELVDALKSASVELLAAKREAERAAKTGKSEKKKDDDKDEKKKDDWRPILSKYGITEEEATVKNAHTEIKYVRVKPGDFKVSTETDQIIFRANLGDFVAAIPAKDGIKAKTLKTTELTIGSGPKNLEKFTFTFGAPFHPKTKSTFALNLPVVLTTPMDVSKPWRKPEDAEIVGPK